MRLLSRILVAMMGTLVLARVVFAQAVVQLPAKQQERPIALVGGTIHPVASAPIERGTVVFNNGVITAMGASVSVPAGTEAIDVSGKHIYPGLISADTYLGLTEIGAVRASNDRSETGRINPNVRAETAVNPESELIPVARANGITLAVSSPSGGVISGTSAMLYLDGWTWEEMTFKAPAALIVNWPPMTIFRSPSGRPSEEDQKKEREKSLRELEDAFRDARAYMVAKKAEQQKGIPYHDVDVRWEAMIPALEGKVPVLAWAREVQQIQAAIAWAEREGVKVIIGGGHDAWLVPDLLKRNNIPVLAGGILRLPGRRSDAYDEPFTLPKKLYDAGVRFAIITGAAAGHERNLPYHAAMAAAYGLPKEEALKAITLYPAEIYGVADRVGSLAVGKEATMIVTTGDPLEITSNVELQFMRGRKIDITSRHTRLYEKYGEKYKRLKK